MEIYDDNRCDYLYHSYRRSLIRNLKLVKELRRTLFTRVQRMRNTCKNLSCIQCRRRWRIAFNAVNGRFLPKVAEDTYEQGGSISKNKKRCLMRRRNNWASLEVKWTTLVLEMVNKKRFEPKTTSGFFIQKMKYFAT